MLSYTTIGNNNTDNGVKYTATSKSKKKNRKRQCFPTCMCMIVRNRVRRRNKACEKNSKKSNGREAVTAELKCFILAWPAVQRWK